MRLASVLGVPVAATDLPAACAHLEQFVRAGRAAYVCFANVHLVELAQRDEAVLRALTEADLVVPDGAPIAWAARTGARITGSDMYSALNERAAQEGYRVFLLGSTDETLSDLRLALEAEHPGIEVVGSHAPPYAAVEELDVAVLADLIDRSRADLVWIGLGAPKQELVMQRLRPLLRRGVLLGVGAVFDFASGRKARAPEWLQHIGLEWMHRLAAEPGRLWRRYLFGNTRFVLLLMGHALKTRQLRG